MNSQSNLLPLADDWTVYRGARSRSWIDLDNSIMLPEAFYLRPNEDGLSVNYNCSLDAAREVLKPCHGIAELGVGSIRGIENLDVVPTPPIEGLPPHAEIMGLPHQEEHFGRARYLANQLSDLAQLVWHK